MILNPLILRTTLLLCSTFLYACGGSSGSSNSVAVEEKTSEESTLEDMTTEEKVVVSSSEENANEDIVTTNETDEDIDVDDIFSFLPTTESVADELIIPDDSNSESDEGLVSTPIIEDETVNLNITWDDNSDNEVEFIIERRMESEVDYGETYYVAENTTSYDDLDVQAGETYCYRISASNSVGDSPSSEKCITL
ncbi:fibronectin type III domain-containing protein [Psychromonas sp. SP041]|uniref:fibronectin type III domain-containing protein n=1 Tax=Psychromonas sp. SP041 TaxID=1365007 RepID=UPI00047013E4|nr:fibronectin type III domain-containing protein [Psychromonas sp. SP041]